MGGRHEDTKGDEDDEFGHSEILQRRREMADYGVKKKQREELYSSFPHSFHITASKPKQPLERSL